MKSLQANPSINELVAESQERYPECDPAIATVAASDTNELGKAIAAAENEHNRAKTDSKVAHERYEKCKENPDHYGNVPDFYLIARASDKKDQELKDAQANDRLAKKVSEKQHKLSFPVKRFIGATLLTLTLGASTGAHVYESTPERATDKYAHPLETYRTNEALSKGLYGAAVGTLIGFGISGMLKDPLARRHAIKIAERSQSK